jgi:hypothetical protein
VFDGWSSSHRESPRIIPVAPGTFTAPWYQHVLTRWFLHVCSNILGRKFLENIQVHTRNQTQFVRVAEVKQGALLQRGPKQVWRRPRLWATSVKFFGVFVGCLTIYLVASAIITTWDHSPQGRVKSSWCSCLMVTWRIHFILHHVALIVYGWMEVEIMCDSLVVLIWCLCPLFQSFCQSERVGSSWL